MSRPPAPAAWPERKVAKCESRVFRAGQAAALLPLALVLVTTLLVAVAPGRPNAAVLRRSGALNAVSYTRIVNDILIPRSWLVRVDDPVTGRPAVTLTQGARGHPQVLRFLNNSYLADDLAADDPDLWRFEGNRLLSINPSTHSFFDPFFGRAQWTGDLGFRDEGSHASRAVPVLFEHRPNRPQDVPISLTPSFEKATSEGVVTLESQEHIGDVSRGFTLNAGGATVARISLVGDRPVIVLACSQARNYDITVTTAAYLPGACATGNDGANRETVAYPLTDGDVVDLRLRGNASVFLSFRVSREGSMLSTYRPFGARSFDHVAEHLGRDFVQAMDRVVNTERSGAETEVRRLSLSRAISAQTESVLYDEMSRLQENLGRAPQDYFPAAVTVMDATNGELLALASYPRRDDLNDNWAARTSSLARNQNFMALAVGSAAKVPVSAGILARFPDLVNLCVNGSSADSEGHVRIHSLLGVSVDPYIPDTVRGGRVDFNRFLRSSSNRFGATLMLLSAARQQPGASGASFAPAWERPARALPTEEGLSFGATGGCGNSPVRQAPSFVFLSRQTGGRAAELGSELLPVAMRLRDAQGGRSWIETFQQLFSINDIANAAPIPTDPSIWFPILGNSEENYDFLAGISPDRERFLRPDQGVRDYLMIMLGGSNARWTAVKLAEAYARIVTGRRISATLIPQAGSQPASERLDLPAPVRRALLTGMGQAAGMGQNAAERDHATAVTIGALAREIPIANGEVIRVFAKTGTPGLQTRARTPLNDLMNRLIGARVITLGSGGLEVARPSPGETARQALQRLAADRHIDLAAPEAERVLAAMRRMNVTFERGQNIGLTFDGPGRLSGLEPDTEVRRADDDASQGGVLVMVIGRYCASDIEAIAPLRALSIVANVQARAGFLRDGERHAGRNPSIILMERLLGDRNGALVEWLRAPADRRRCAR